MASQGALACGTCLTELGPRALLRLRRRAVSPNSRLNSVGGKCLDGQIYSMSSGYRNETYGVTTGEAGPLK